MPRYFFHNEDGRCYPDATGVELPDMAAVRHTALQVLTEMMDLHEKDVWDTGAWRVTVADEAGLTLYVVDLAITGSAAVSTDRSSIGSGEALT